MPKKEKKPTDMLDVLNAVYNETATYWENCYYDHWGLNAIDYCIILGKPKVLEKILKKYRIGSPWYVNMKYETLLQHAAIALTCGKPDWVMYFAHLTKDYKDMVSEKKFLKSKQAFNSVMGFSMGLLSSAANQADSRTHNEELRNLSEESAYNKQLFYDEIADAKEQIAELDRTAFSESEQMFLDDATAFYEEFIKSGDKIDKQIRNVCHHPETLRPLITKNPAVSEKHSD